MTPNTLIERLRGLIRVPVNDGAGLLNDKDFFERQFPASKIALEAAARIEALEAALREAERFVSYLANETDGIFVGSGTPATCLVMIRAALNQQNPDR